MSKMMHFELSGRVAKEMEAVAVVSSEDIDLWEFKWNLKIKGGVGYAARRLRVREGRREVYLHRVVMERMVGRRLKGWEIVDHVNGHGLDCSRGNLRVCGKGENGCNVGKRKGEWSSKYKGVYRAKNGTWMVKCVRGKSIHRFGPFYDEGEAAYVYNMMATMLHGEFAWKNDIQGLWSEGFDTVFAEAEKTGYLPGFVALT